ncbi:cupin domain-containing protein [Macrococcoides bohemicum]|uniref:Cupin domain-containing protein n=1 Tax=Macrococcoides bohemicum TaxID=1903056 RepID=A0AAJ4TWW6_9STAP|nr:cupin domain-containing protein [Macrococcus bohemicus]QYA42880.1 cupin domain-containing protein [Macrococcus bohemicus]QYA45231.1 cupin domain-containing protein [Macrococcus bohemicus]
MKEISERIKFVRKSKGITLKELSESTGLSVSFLSQVERGESSLAITSLNKIAESLNEHITSFFDQPVNEDFKIVPKEVKTFTLENSNQRFTKTSSEFENRKLESFLIEVQPGDQTELSRHEGEEHYHVLEGELTFNVNGRTYNIGKDEIIHYPSLLEHSYKNNHDKVAKVLCVLTPKLF